MPQVLIFNNIILNKWPISELHEECTTCDADDVLKNLTTEPLESFLSAKELPESTAKLYYKGILKNLHDFYDIISRTDL